MLLALYQSINWNWFDLIWISCTQGRRPRGDWGGRSPPKFEVGGTAHALVPPNILRSSVVRCAWKHEQSEKLCFSCEEMVIYTTFNTVNIRKMWEKKGKIRRTRPMTKKKVIRNFYPGNGNFSWNWAAKKFFGPPKFGARSPPMPIPIMRPIMTPIMKGRLWVDSLSENFLVTLKMTF